ncbi:MAG: tail fiber domain-containing protein [Bacteroidales bacterium]|jgi:hypothetical protein|nr:tail fiber domain-containing protein [Bacteroidales bacterium]
MKNSTIVKVVFVAAILFVGMQANAQVAINDNGAVPDGSAILDLRNTVSKGLLIPQFTIAARPTNPAQGLLYYQLDGAQGFYYNAGSPSTPTWASFSSALGGVGNYAGVAFWTNSTTLSDSEYFMWDNANARLGVGVPEPAYRLHVKYSGSEYTAGIINTNSSSGQGLFIQAGTGTNNSLSVQNNEGSTKFVVKANGNVGIGITAPDQLLKLLGGAYCNGINWFIGSDKNIKRNISEYSYGLELVLKMNPISFIYKEDSKNRAQIGFVAQEIKELVPEAVDGEEGNLAISYGSLVPVLVNAIKEQNAIIKSQEEKIKSLEERLSAVEKLLAK